MKAVVNRNTFLKYLKYSNLIEWLIIVPAWAAMAYIIYIYFGEIQNGGGAWKTGDWLINYYAGPIRRGFIGSLILWISNLGVPLKWVAFLVQSLLCFGVYFYVTKIYLLRKRNIYWLAVLYSPVFILFPYYDPEGGFRKEIILFFAFSYFSFHYGARKLCFKKSIVGLIIYFVAAFSHELSCFAIPFYFYIIKNCKANGSITKAQYNFLLGVLLAITGAALTFSLYFTGSPAVAVRVCDTLNHHMLSDTICGGSIAWLGLGTKQTISFVLHWLWSYLYNYPILFALGFLPILLTNWPTRERVWVLIIGLIFFIPLFSLAIDWGRWIAMYFFIVYCLILSEDCDFKIKDSSFNRFVLFVYLVSWSVPHCCSGKIGKGLFALIFRL